MRQPRKLLYVTWRTESSNLSPSVQFLSANPTAPPRGRFAFVLGHAIADAQHVGEHERIEIIQAESAPRRRSDNTALDR
jgi:hypothetical protein